ncbi:Uncharacterised protein [Metamycoplasma cloacale]|uniref:Uncharacterized protein n=1 Tax=Metamycoplasma cloacale TaxID=92401 RepID=A0A2Z4LLP8_9BACT|nr:hypothetical protein [Metamycoplasma cloacale]AWX42692.1 hypothetical protein DK849_01205 [Metamycoplasma cloacale]VEU79496.1 Uncharacterised protein [Metamycoplasma cloacale]
MHNLKILSNEKKRDIQAGFAATTISSILSFIPTGISIVSSIIGAIKSLTSAKAEIKTKDFSYKWDQSVEPMQFTSSVHYCR